MLAAHAGDPALRAFELAVQRTHFAYLAAAFAILDRIAEAEHAVAGDQGLDLGGFRGYQADAQAIADLGKLDGLEHLGEQTAGIESEDVDVGPGLGNGIKDGLIVEAEARGEGDASLHRPPHLGDPLSKVLDAREPRIELHSLAL